VFALEALLSAKGWDLASAGATDLLVLPRPGSRTPWSTRAGEIIRHCGLADFAEVERATLLRFNQLPEGGLSRASLRQLHDRMTQVILSADADLSPWFEDHAPGPLGVIALGDHRPRPWPGSIASWAWP
jgi:phosphoribosylformylglycinamidine synthase